MRTVPSGLASHITGHVTSLARLCVITRTDGTVKRITDVMEDLTVSSVVYAAAPGIKLSAVQSKNDGTGANFTITVAARDNGVIDFADLISGFYDRANVAVYLVNQVANAGERLQVFGGEVGTITIDDRGWADIECIGLTALARAQIAPKFQQTCRADLGDAKCKIPILPDDVARSTAYALGAFVRAKVGGTGYVNYYDRYYECTTPGTTASSAPTYNVTLGATTTDGSAVFTARNAWLRYGTVTSLVDEFSFVANLPGSGTGFPNDWFKWGAVIWRSGLSAGTMVECRGWTLSSGDNGTLTIMMPTPGAIAPGDQFEVFAGCDKRASTCLSKFNNLPNFRGEPHVPGPVTA